jgi:hypothetical protein
MGLSCQLHAPAAFHPEKDPRYPMERKLSGLDAEDVNKDKRKRNKVWKNNYIESKDSKEKQDQLHREEVKEREQNKHRRIINKVIQNEEIKKRFV